MKASEIITEIGDSYFKWTAQGKDYVFKNSKGIKYEVRFDSRRRIGKDSKEQSELSIVFVMLPKKSGQHAAGWKTGVGDEFKTFATVKQIVQHHLGKINLANLDMVYFQAMATEPSRVKLYNRFVPEVLKILGPGWEYESEDATANLKTYRFKNINKLQNI